MNDHVFWQHDGHEVEFGESDLVGRYCELHSFEWMPAFGRVYLVVEYDHVGRMLLVRGPCQIDACPDSVDEFWVHRHEAAVE